MKCPISRQNCENKCALWVDNKGCAMKVEAFVAEGNAKALHEINENLKELRAEIAEIPLQILAIAEAVKSGARDIKPSAPEKFTEISDSSLERYCEAINPLEVSNTPTKSVFSKFEKWCKGRGYEPCTQMKLTRRMCEVHALKSEDGIYRPIRKGSI